jgi:hypothetical protein
MLKHNEDSKKKSEKSESITFRMEKTVLDELRKEAGQRMESINTLVNQIIISYLQWHKPAKQAGLGYISKALMSKTINHLTDEQVVQMTKEFYNNQLKDITFMLRTEKTFSSFMKGLCVWLDASGYNYRIDSSGDNDGDDTEVYVIQFDMGKNWSLYFKTQMELAFEHYKITDSQCEMTNNIVVIKIKNRKKRL